MTVNIYVNPLSAANQFTHICDAILYMELFIKVLKRAIGNTENAVVYDSRISVNKLVDNDTIDNVAFKLGQANRVLWFNLRKKMTSLKIGSSEAISILENNNEVLHGEVDPEYSRCSKAWISLGGLSVLNQGTIRYKSEAEKYSIINLSCLEHAESFFPIYQPNPKHRKKGYYDQIRNEYVSPMPLTDEKAQEFLNESHLLANGDRIFRNRVSEEFYLFKVTERNIYHGFQIKKEDLSAEGRRYFYQS